MMGTKGTQGVLKGLSISGLDFLNTITLIHTIINARRVPIDTSCPRMLIGSIPAIIIATEPVIIVLT